MPILGIPGGIGKNWHKSEKIGLPPPLISSIFSKNGCPVIRISELFHEQLRYVILKRFNHSSRPILNNISGERSLLLKKIMEKLLFSR